MPLSSDKSAAPRWTQMTGDYISGSTSGIAGSATLSIRDGQAVLKLGEQSHTLRLSREFGADRTAMLQETIEAQGRKYHHTWPIRALPDDSLELDHIRFTSQGSPTTSDL